MEKVIKQTGTKLSRGEKIFRRVAVFILTIIAIICILPLLLIIAGSFSSESSVIKEGFTFYPREFSVEAFKVIFSNPKDLLNAYFISILRVVIGTTVSLFLTAMTGYVLSRRDFKYRRVFSFLIYFTSIFSGGLVPWYLMIVNTLHLSNTFIVLILPMLLNVFNIIITKSFMSSIPFEVIEACKIDGAGEFRTFVKVIMPMAKPALTTVGVFISLAYWNDFFQAMLFITDEKLYPLQYYLYRVVNTADALNRVAAMTGMAVPDMPTQTLKLAMTVLVVIPVLFIYPLAQKHIVEGISVGAVKG